MVNNLFLQKKLKKISTFLIAKQLKVFKFTAIFFYQFFFYFLSSKKNLILNQYFMNINYLFLLNVKDRQPKINLIDLNLNKKYVFTIGLVLKILNLFKKCSRRSIPMLKYVVNFILKKFTTSFNQKQFMLVIKGIQKNFIKLLYFFNFLIQHFDINLFYLMPLKTFKLLKIKKIRFIKRRVKKKLISFNN